MNIKGIVLLPCLLVLLVTQLQGCAGFVLAGGTVVAVAHDRRTAGTMLEDQTVEMKANSSISSDKELKEQSHINVTSYNLNVLLTGEAPTDTLRSRAENATASVPKVRKVHNQIVIAAPSSMGARSSDTWITTKVKTQLLNVEQEDFDPSRIKVVTESGSVYLMGLVTRSEADAAVESIRQVKGVQRVVKLFEYID